MVPIVNCNARHPLPREPRDPFYRGGAFHRRGSALVYVTATMVALVAFASLAVDLARVYVVRSELQLAADAAARYGASGLATDFSIAEAYAVDAANDNQADGTPVVLNTSTDVEFGVWTSANRTFVALSGPARSGANAIRVTVRRTSASGNAVPLFFARVVGRTQFDVTASAIATKASPAMNYGVMALSEIEMEGNAQTDSYNSAVAPYSAGYGPDKGGVGTNGEMEIEGNAVVRGDARRMSGLPQVSGNAIVTGSTSPSGSALVLPAATSNGYSYSNNNNRSIPSGFRIGQDMLVDSSALIHIDAGNYFFNNFTMTDGRLNVRGPATIYVSGNLKIEGNAQTLGNRPGDLRFVLLGSGEVDFDGNYGIYADVYAPQSEVDIEGNKHLYGRVVGRTVELEANSQVHYDESLAPPGGQGGSIALVR